MSIKTQRIEIYEDVDPLLSKTVDLPIHNGVKIMSHEPYAAELLKRYTSCCTDEDMQVISACENIGKEKDICGGVVSSYDEENKTAEIRLSQKHVVVVDMNPNENIQVGGRIDVVVSKARGRLIGDASSKSAQLERLKQELLHEIQEPSSAFSAVVKDVVYNVNNVFNGFVVDIRGVKCFMPGTESNIVPLNDFNELVGKELYVMPVNVIKDSIIVSHKEYLNTLRPGVLKKLGDTQVGTLVSGKISSVKNFGVFILIDECVATLLSVSEMNEETENKFKAGELKSGDDIMFYVDNIKGERVTVTQTASKAEGWEKLKEAVEKEENYLLKGTVKNIFNNGVVIISEEFNGITFFLSAKVVKVENLKVGNPVSLPVDTVDTSNKNVRLKID